MTDQDSVKKCEPMPVVRLLADNIPSQHHFDAWTESTSPLFRSEPLATDWRFYRDSTCYLVGQLMFTHVQFPKTAFSRTQSEIRSGDGDSIVLQYNVSGRQKGLLNNGERLQLGPDRIVLTDFAHGYSSVSEPTETYRLFIPRPLIKASSLIYRKRPVIRWGIDSIQGRLLKSALASIWRDLPQTNHADGEVIANGFVGLLNGLLSSEKHSAPPP